MRFKPIPWASALPLRHVFILIPSATMEVYKYAGESSTWKKHWQISIRAQDHRVLIQPLRRSEDSQTRRPHYTSHPIRVSLSLFSLSISSSFSLLHWRCNRCTRIPQCCRSVQVSAQTETLCVFESESALSFEGSLWPPSSLVAISIYGVLPERSDRLPCFTNPSDSPAVTYRI